MGAEFLRKDDRFCLRHVTAFCVNLQLFGGRVVKDEHHAPRPIVKSPSGAEEWLSLFIFVEEKLCIWRVFPLKMIIQRKFTIGATPIFFVSGS
jgi:hypothetical protein